MEPDAFSRRYAKKKDAPLYVFLFFLFDIEALLEAINTSASVNKLLLSGIERMAFGTDINLHLFLCGPGLKCFTAYAANDAFAVLGMNVFLHCCFTSFAYAMAVEPQMVLYHNCGLFATVFLCFHGFSGLRETPELSARALYAL